MKYKKSHFVFNSGERNGIFVLVLLIVILQLVYFLYPFGGEEPISETEEYQITLLRSRLDSLKVAREKSRDTIYPFNPNYLSDAKAYRLGLKIIEIDRLLEFRSQGKWINSGAEFQQVTGISDSLLKKLQEYFNFPEWVQNKNRAANTGYTSDISKLDLNEVSSAQLQEINGIGQTLGERIVSYRQKLGRYRSLIQLKDIYGLSTETRSLLEQRLLPISDDFKKKNLNTASVLELSEIPYFNYEIAREIVNYRNLHEGIRSFEDLSKIQDFPVSRIDRIQLYLYIN